MDSSLQALQTNVKFIFQISESYFELITIFKNNSGVGFMHAGCGEAFVLISTRSS